MVSKTLVTFALAATTLAQQTDLVSVSYDSTLETYYYFRDGEGSITINADGILVTADCDTLAKAQIVYSADDGEDVLVTANCYDVFYLVTPEQQAITWTSCTEFSFYQALCESGSSSVIEDASSVTETTTGVVSSSAVTVSSSSATSSLPQTTVSNDETYVLTTVTSYESNEETLYTTYCPLTDIIITASAYSAANTPDYTVVQVTVTSYATVGADGAETTVTDLVQITPETPSTTVVTITSCSENKCSIIPVTTGITVVTSSEGGVVSEYTTYCPLTSEETFAPATTKASATEAAATGATSTDVTSTKAASTETASTKAASTETTITKPSTESAATGSPAGTTVEEFSSTTAAEETAGAVSTFEGAGAKVVGSMSIGVIVAVVGLFL